MNLDSSKVKNSSKANLNMVVLDISIILTLALALTALDPGACRAWLRQDGVAICSTTGAEPHAPFCLTLELERSGPGVCMNADVLLRIDPGTEIAVVVPGIDASVPFPVVVLPVDSKRTVASRGRGGSSCPVVGLHDIGGRDAAGDQEHEGGELGDLHFASCVLGEKCGIKRL